MQIIHKEQTQEFKNSDVCTAIEYPLHDKDINAAVIKLNGRYPDRGRVVNTECKELGCVVKGSGKVVVEDVEHILNVEDVVLINSGERFYWEGEMTILMSCTPAWHPDQHKEVE